MSSVEIKIGGDTYEIQPEVLADKYNDFRKFRAEMDGHKESIKTLIDLTAGETKLPKKIIRRYFADRYKQVLEAQKAEADAVESLRLALEV